MITTQNLSGKPVISVILPVYNAEKYLRDSIDSILKQSYKDFELIILNDGSTDFSGIIINSYNDSRISYVENDINIGLIKTLNLGISLAKGKYIARMDADDISLPERLKKQVSFMEKNKKVVACGTWIKHFEGNDNVRKYPVNDEDIKTFFVFRSPIAHPSVIMRAFPFKKTPPLKYNENYPHAEDYKLWADLMDFGELANISEYLIKYRVSTDQITLNNGVECDKTSRKIRREYINSIFIKLNIPKTPKIITLKDIKILSNQKGISPKIKSMILHTYYLSLNNYSLSSLLYFIKSFSYFSDPYTHKEFLRVLHSHIVKNKKWL